MAAFSQFIRGGRLGLLAVALCAVSLAACDQQHVHPEPPLVVEMYTVGKPVVERERTFHGVVVPADLTRVSFRIAGKIDKLAVEAGQRVSRGQPLAHIEDSIQRQIVADSRAQYELSERQLARADLPARLHGGEVAGLGHGRFPSRFRRR